MTADLQTRDWMQTQYSHFFLPCDSHVPVQFNSSVSAPPSSPVKLDRDDNAENSFPTAYYNGTDHLLNNFVIPSQNKNKSEKSSTVQETRVKRPMNAFMVS